MIRALYLAGALIAAPVATAQTAAPPAAAPAAVDPAQLAAAERTVALLVPQGVYAKMMREQYPRVMEAMLASMGGISAADAGGTEPGSILDAARAQDPAFDERMRIMTRVMGEEFAPVMAQVEPQVRAGLAAAFARRFTVAQLADMNAFFTTPSGKAFADNFLSLFADPDMIREMSKATPLLMQAMPKIVQKVEAATAHLPPPPKPESDD
ncbi:DUF2059 domain-containing protein [Sphingomonas sp. ac-8]|uniref:DUF2059 domain-containing protein n=1 Tax=Sphingomonas sp. ac-8 TaxID=3242977 RepID=UPI003A81151D